MPNKKMKVDNNYSELPQELWLKIVSLLDEPEDLSILAKLVELVMLLLKKKVFGKK